MSLLAYLALRKPKESSNDEVQGLFWPDSDGDKQAQSLRRAISDLRKVLERDLPLGSVIVTRKGHVSLNPGRVATDVERFLDLTRRNEEDQTRLDEAVGLYAGPLLPALSSNWALGHRMEVEERFGQAVERLCEILVQQGKAKEAISIGRAAVVAAPGREDVQVALIKACGAAGMAVEALKQFEELERMLDETWGETPSTHARDALEAAFVESQPRKNNLPEQLTSFIGRAKEIDEVCELLSKTRLLTLTGSGGCGKTRLSLQVASRVLDQYRDGVWFVEFAALTDPSLVPNTVAVALGLTEQPGKPIEQTLLDYLKAKQLLLVLDNCEHLLLACAQLAEAVLRQCPSVVVLANSREGLAIGSELVYRVPSLSLPSPKDPQTPDSLAQYESVQLFTERAVQVQRAFAVTDQNASALASVCQRLDGIPLAIELAAARLRSLSVEEINGKLDQRFRLLTGGARTALPRQQTLRSLIDWSYDLLNEPEQALLCRLAVFAGGWTLESAEQVCAGGPLEQVAMLDLLTSLCDKNLVVAEQAERSTRYRMLETVRQYARDRLLESGASEEYRDRHQAYFLALAKEAEPNLTGPNQQAWLERLEGEHENVRSALEWGAAAGGSSDAGLQLALAIKGFWTVRSHFSEGRAWMSRLLGTCHGGEADPVRADALHSIGLFATLLGDYAGALATNEESLAIRRKLNDRKGVSNSVLAMGNVAIQQGDYLAARSYYEESLELNRELGDRLGIAKSLNNLGAVANQHGDHPTAHALLHEGLAIFREVGNHAEVARALVALADLAHNLGDYLSGQAMAAESLAIRTALGDRAGVASSLRRTGSSAYHQGDFSAARTQYQESLAISRAIGELSTVVECLRTLAYIHAAVHQPLRAAILCGAAERLREELGVRLLPTDAAVFEHEMKSVKVALGDDEAFDRAWQEGREMTMEQAIELAHTSPDS